MIARYTQHGEVGGTLADVYDEHALLGVTLAVLASAIPSEERGVALAKGGNFDVALDVLEGALSILVQETQIFYKLCMNTGECFLFVGIGHEKRDFASHRLIAGAVDLPEGGLEKELQNLGPDLVDALIDVERFVVDVEFGQRHVAVVHEFHVGQRNVLCKDGNQIIIAVDKGEVVLLDIGSWNLIFHEEK